MADTWPLHIDANAPNDPVFVGVGELPSGRYPERNFIGDLTHVGLLALADARMVPRDVDTILLIPCLHSPFDQADLIFSRMAEELGLLGHLKSSFMVHSGGSTSDNAVRLASGLIASGHARTVLVLHCERWGSADLNAMVTMLSKYGIPNEWEAPTGLQFNAIGALITRRYMHATQSSAADMASFCVTLRKWAQLNPNAMYRGKTLTVEKVLASKVVADPLHALECPMLADGAVAFVMTSAENAKVRDLAALGWATAARRAYEQSGWGPKDAQIAQIYDTYAAVTTIAVEGLGFCKPGEGARWFASGAADPGGKLPCNTNGGMLSAGHTGVGGGTALLVEGVRQLLGRAGPERQISGVQRCIVGGTGGSYMDAQVLLLERRTRGRQP
jgi:acetyl-CoA C-acetyltransferase